MKEPKPDSPEWRIWARLAFDRRINEVQQLREQLAAERKRASEAEQKLESAQATIKQYDDYIEELDRMAEETETT
jgi:RNase H-fold protein (predicted Holliday junction resolvase)